MNIRSVRNGFTIICATAIVAVLHAEEARERLDAPATKAGTTAARSTRSTATGKGPLPDPVLLDGSTLPAEKKSEQGMLGDFELPGDENARNNRVGGQQQQMPPGAAGGQQMPMGLPQSGGGGPGQPPQGQMPQSAQASAGGAQAPQGQQPQQPGGGGPAGPSDPNAKAEGAQVGQLQTDPNAGGDAGATDGQKPQQVAIGDQAMQIKGVSNAPGVIGAAVPAGQTQQMEKGVGGGKGSSAVRGGSNAAEKGRAMPAGL